MAGTLGHWDSLTTTEVSFKSLSHAMKPHNIQSQLTGVIYRSEGVKGGIIGPGSLSCLVLVFIRRKPRLRADTGGSDEYKYCEMLSGLSWLAGWCTGASCQPATCPPPGTAQISSGNNGLGYFSRICSLSCFQECERVRVRVELMLVLHSVVL